MNSTEKDFHDDALIMVAMRNEFYRKKFHFVLWVYILSLIVVGFLICVVVYLVRHPTHPLYFVTDKVGRLIQDIPKTKPNMSNDEVSNWVVEAIQSAYSYDVVNYREELQSAQKYFTDYGWHHYMAGLQASNNLVALTQRKLIVVAKVVDKPKLLVEGILGGAYAWKFQLPLLVTYYSAPYDAKSSFSNPLLVTVVVQRQSILTSYKGLGIVQTFANLITGPQDQTLSPPPT